MRAGLSFLVAFASVAIAAIGQSNDTVLLIENKCEPGQFDSGVLREHLEMSLTVKTVMVNDEKAEESQKLPRIVIVCGQAGSGKAAEVDLDAAVATVFTRNVVTIAKSEAISDPQAYALLLAVCTGSAARLLGMEYCVNPFCALNATTQGQSAMLCPPCYVKISQRVAVKEEKSAPAPASAP